MSRPAGRGPSPECSARANRVHRAHPSLGASSGRVGSRVRGRRDRPRLPLLLRSSSMRSNSQKPVAGVARILACALFAAVGLGPSAGLCETGIFDSEIEVVRHDGFESWQRFRTRHERVEATTRADPGESPVLCDPHRDRRAAPRSPRASAGTRRRADTGTRLHLWAPGRGSLPARGQGLLGRARLRLLHPVTQRAGRPRPGCLPPAAATRSSAHDEKRSRRTCAGQDWGV